MSEAKILFPCPACGVTNRLPVEKADKKAKCGKCGEALPPIGLTAPVTVNEASFQQEVLDSPIPVLVDFWAPWCAPCRQLAPSLETIAVEFAGRLKIAKVNSDENMNLSQRYQIRSIPTLLIFEGGVMKEQISGALPIQQLRVWVQRSLGWL